MAPGPQMPPQAAPMAQAAPPPQMPQGAMPTAAPAPPVTPPQSDASWYQAHSLTIPHARSTTDTFDAAPEAQQRFEAQQAIQRDIDRGMDPQTAISRNAYALMRRGGQPGQKLPPSRDVAGVLYERDPVSGEWKAKTQPKPEKAAPPARMSEPDKMRFASELGSLKTEENVLQSKLLNAQAEDAKGLQAQIKDVRKRRQDLYSQFGLAAPTVATGTGAGTAPAAKPASKIQSPTAANPESKAQRANALRKQHPNWSRQQIIDQVNQEGQ
jgi:hypothetical protein